MIRMTNHPETEACYQGHCYECETEVVLPEELGDPYRCQECGNLKDDPRHALGCNNHDHP